MAKLIYKRSEKKKQTGIFCVNTNCNKELSAGEIMQSNKCIVCLLKEKKNAATTGTIK